MSGQKFSLDKESFSVFYEGKFDGVLDYSACEYVLRYRKTVFDEDSLVVEKWLNEHPNTRCSNDPLIWALQDCFFGKIPDVDMSVQNARELWESNILLQLAHLESSTFGSFQRHFREHMDKVEVLCGSLPRKILKIFSLVLKFRDLLPKTTQYMQSFDPKVRADLLSPENDITVKLSSDMTFRMTGHFVFITFKEDSFIAPSHYFQLVYNKIIELGNILLLSYMLSNTYFSDDFSDNVDFVLRSMFNAALYYGNRYFTLAKSWDSIITGILIYKEKELDPVPSFRTFYDDTFLMNAVEEMEMEFPRFPIHEIFDRLKDLSMDEINEFYPLDKVCGHPSVDVEEGVKKLCRRTRSDLDYNMNTIFEVIGVLAKDFICSYYSINRCWPPLLNLETTDPRIVSAFQKNHSPLKEGSVLQGLDLIYWSTVTLGKVEEFDWSENVLPHLKDKAIAVLTSEAFTTYISEERGKYDPVKTRCLLYYLYGKDIYKDHVEYMKDIELYGFASVLIYLLLKMTSKERELKILARQYGQSTYPERIRKAVIENNTRSFLRKYHPEEQALTMSELDIVKRLYFFNSLEDRNPEYVTFRFNMDMQGWNNSFFDELVALVEENLLDAVFATRQHSTIMEFFWNCIFIAPVRGGEDVAHLWCGQRGGIEGLDQVTWEHVYLGQCKVAAKMVGWKYHILLKGDDTNIIFLVPRLYLKHVGYYAVRDQILKTMKEECEKTGQILKQSDSYVTHRFMRFSKQATLGSTQLSGSLKYCQRITGETNRFFPFDSSLIESLFSSAFTACHNSHELLIPYSVAALHHAFWVVRYFSLSIHELLVVMNTKKCLGGYDVLFLSDFLVRTERDPLTEQLAFYQTILKSYPQSVGTVQNMLKLKKKGQSPLKVCESLSASPWSLNCFFPTTGEVILRNLCERALKTKPGLNPDVRVLLRSKANDYKLLLEDLSTMDPFIPKLASVLCNCHPAHLVRELVMIFESAKTMMSFFIMKGRFRRFFRRQIPRLRKIDKKIQEVFLARVNGTAQYDMIIDLKSSNCVTKVAHHAREVSYGRELFGPTYPPLGCLGKIGLTRDITDVENYKRRFKIVYYPGEQTVKGGNVYTCVGKQDPFLGTRTALGFDDNLLTVPSKNPAVGKVRDILDIAAWFEGRDKNFFLLCSRLLKNYMDIPLEDFVSILPFRYRGTIAHRLNKGHFRSEIFPSCHVNTQTLFATIATVNEYALLDDHNLPVNFLALSQHFLQILSAPLVHNSLHYLRPADDFSLILTQCNDCLYDVDDPKVGIDVSYEPTLSTADSRLLTVPAREIANLQIQLMSQRLQYHLINRRSDHDVSLDSIEKAEFALLDRVGSSLRKERTIQLRGSGLSILEAIGKHEFVHEISYIPVLTIMKWIFTEISRYSSLKVALRENGKLFGMMELVWSNCRRENLVHALRDIGMTRIFPRQISSLKKFITVCGVFFEGKSLIWLVGEKHVNTDTVRYVMKDLDVSSLEREWVNLKKSHHMFLKKWINQFVNSELELLYVLRHISCNSTGEKDHECEINFRVPSSTFLTNHYFKGTTEEESEQLYKNMFVRTFAKMRQKALQEKREITMDEVMKPLKQLEAKIMKLKTKYNCKIVFCNIRECNAILKTARQRSWTYQSELEHPQVHKVTAEEALLEAELEDKFRQTCHIRLRNPRLHPYSAGASEQFLMDLCTVVDGAQKIPFLPGLRSLSMCLLYLDGQMEVIAENCIVVGDPYQCLNDSLKCRRIFPIFSRKIEEKLIPGPYVDFTRELSFTLFHMLSYETSSDQWVSVLQASLIQLKPACLVWVLRKENIAILEEFLDRVTTTEIDLLLIGFLVPDNLKLFARLSTSVSFISSKTIDSISPIPISVFHIKTPVSRSLQSSEEFCQHMIHFMEDPIFEVFKRIDPGEVVPRLGVCPIWMLGIIDQSKEYLPVKLEQIPNHQFFTSSECPDAWMNIYKTFVSISRKIFLPPWLDPSQNEKLYDLLVQRSRLLFKRITEDTLLRFGSHWALFEIWAARHSETIFMSEEEENMNLS